MSKNSKTFNFSTKKNAKNSNYSMEEEEVSFKAVKRNKEQKQYRNYFNALKARNVDRLLAYEEEQ